MLHFDINKFSTRAIIFGVLNFILMIILGLSLSCEDIVNGRFIVYSTLAVSILGIIFEPILAIIQKRRINGPELIGASLLGAISSGFICAAFSLLFGIIK